MFQKVSTRTLEGLSDAELAKMHRRLHYHVWYARQMKHRDEVMLIKNAMQRVEKILKSRGRWDYRLWEPSLVNWDSATKSAYAVIGGAQ